MNDVLSWLREQITERKALAEAADAASPGPWTNTGQDGCGDAWQIHGAPTGETEPDWDSPDMEEKPVLGRVATLNYDDGGGVWEEDAANHIVLNQPRDVITRCEAELAILDEMLPVLADLESIAHGEGQAARHPRRPGEYLADDGAVASLVRLLAFGYRHRPGWSPGWAPGE